MTERVANAPGTPLIGYDAAPFNAPLRAPGRPISFGRSSPAHAVFFDVDRAKLVQTRQTLANGRILSSGLHAFGEDGWEGGQIFEVVTMAGRRGAPHVEALVKTVEQGGTQERFAYEVARAMGIESLLPTIVRRADGAAVIELRPGETFDWHGIRTGNHLEHAIRASLQTRHPHMAPAEVARSARVRRELVQMFHIVLANGDGHGGNALYDALEGVTLIDHALIDQEPLHRGMSVTTSYAGGANMRTGARYGHGIVNRYPVSDEVRAIVAATDRSRIERAFAQLLRDQRGATSVGEYAHPQEARFLHEIFGRLDDIVRTGWMKTVHVPVI